MAAATAMSTDDSDEPPEGSWLLPRPPVDLVRLKKIAGLIAMTILTAAVLIWALSPLWTG